MEVKFEISGFFQRIWAFGIDALLVGTVCYLSFSALSSVLPNYGGVTFTFLGLIIGLLYFSFGNSEIMKGQTIGKLAFNLQVVDSNGQLLNLKTSLIRSLILIGPLYFYDFTIPRVSLVFSLVIAIIQSTSVIALLGLVLFYVFNSSSRQSFHDMVIGSFVIKMNRLYEPNALSPNPTFVRYVYAGILAVYLVYCIVRFLPKVDGEDNVSFVYQKISSLEGVREVDISSKVSSTYQATTQGNSSSETYIYEIEIKVDKLPANSDSLLRVPMVKKAITYALQYEPTINEFDEVKLVLVEELDLGFFNSEQSSSITKSPKEWRKTKW
ncbi:MAG: RDD family protein [Cytophagales bacterium]|nr:RDD family protein [Cytophagales bacterium]